jgi:hypothetical protein
VNLSEWRAMKDAENILRFGIYDQLKYFASVSEPGARCIALWPDNLASVYILDRGRRLRDVAYHANPEMIEVLQERYPALTVGQVVYLPRLSPEKGWDLNDFFAGRNMHKLKENL